MKHPLSVTIEDIRNAQKTIQGVINLTPCDFSKSASDLIGSEIILKLENTSELFESVKKLKDKYKKSKGFEFKFTGIKKDSDLNIKSTPDLVNHDNIKIAVGDPGFVPAGKYADEVFNSLKITDFVKDKLVYGKDVREVLAWVESGNLDAGFVYHTDALITDKVKIIELIDSSLHSPIVYPACIVMSSKKQEASADFITYLSSEDAKNILKDYGFLLSY